MNQTTVAGTRYVLAVKDLEKSSAYYAGILGFKSVWEADGWHCLRRDRFCVMLGECPDERSAFETRNHSYFAYIEVHGIDALYEEYRSKGVVFISGPENRPWRQREFGIVTIDGHRIMFGEEI